MREGLDRRTVLRAGAALGALGAAGCRGGADFPQGVASGDPRPDRVLLWTRAVADAPGDVTVRWELATDPDLKDVVASGEVAARAGDDHTARVVATGLAPRTTYWYRFRVGGSRSPIGRTRTAPAPDDDVPLRIAVASCQDFIGRYYHAWKALLDEPDVDLVLCLGDYVYEAVDLAQQLEVVVGFDPLLSSLGLEPVLGRFDDVVRSTGPHFVHADATPYGLAIVTFDRDGMTAELLSTSDATDPAYGGVLARVVLTCPPDRSVLCQDGVGSGPTGHPSPVGVTRPLVRSRSAVVSSSTRDSSTRTTARTSSSNSVSTISAPAPTITARTALVSGYPYRTTSSTVAATSTSFARSSAIPAAPP
jgi:hypothetical protein